MGVLGHPLLVTTTPRFQASHRPHTASAHVSHIGPPPPPWAGLLEDVYSQMRGGPWVGGAIGSHARQRHAIFRSTSKTSRASVAQWLECSTHDRKVPGSNSAADTWVFLIVFSPPSPVLLPRTTVEKNAPAQTRVATAQARGIQGR